MSLVLAALLSLLLAACGPGESPVEPGTPEPFSSPGVQDPGAPGAPGASP
jgi:hypothetical protein